MNTDAIPLELRERPQWVLWRAEQRGGKTTKVPYRVDKPNVKASTTDPATWATFETSVAGAETLSADGIGYVFSPEDPYVGIDLDGELSEADRAAIVLALDSYAEESVSGNGVHVIVKASLNGHGRHPHGFGVFDRSRFFVVTGRHVAGTPSTIEERQAKLDRVLDEFLPAKEPTRAPLPPHPVDLDDEELLERAFMAKNGTKFRRLWDGDWAGYTSQSEADLALCSSLAFWTGRDPERIDRLFRASRLYREKWERADYRKRTIEEAIGGCRDVFEPNEATARADAELAAAFVKVKETGSSDAPPGDSEEELFVGLSHAEVLDLSFGTESPELIEGLIPIGVLVIVAGLPETYKGWVCAKAAAIVAAGEGELFGRPAAASGPVGYFWQDDSTRNEAERVQLFARVQETAPDLAVRWFLNEGAILPDDLGRLRATIEHFGFVMVVLDSVYNFTPGLDLKDRDVGQLFARIKAEICDPTGCTVVVVDHMPWATETNRKRLRSYGDVFKGAAARAAVYIDAEGSKLYVEARGNNIRGFKRTAAYWDADALELRLVDVQQVDEEERQERVLSYLAEHPAASTTKVETDVKGRAEIVRETLKTLEEAGRVTSRSSGELGRGGTGTFWFLSADAPLQSVPLLGTGSDDLLSQSHQPVPPSHPRRGTGCGTDGVKEALEAPREARVGASS